MSSGRSRRFIRSHLRQLPCAPCPVVADLTAIDPDVAYSRAQCEMSTLDALDRLREAEAAEAWRTGDFSYIEDDRERWRMEERWADEQDCEVACPN